MKKNDTTVVFPSNEECKGRVKPPRLLDVLGGLGSKPVEVRKVPVEFTKNFTWSARVIPHTRRRGSCLGLAGRIGLGSRRVAREPSTLRCKRKSPCTLSCPVGRRRRGRGAFRRCWWARDPGGYFGFPPPGSSLRRQARKGRERGSSSRRRPSPRKRPYANPSVSWSKCLSGLNVRKSNGSWR